MILFGGKGRVRIWNLIPLQHKPCTFFTASSGALWKQWAAKSADIFSRFIQRSLYASRAKVVYLWMMLHDEVQAGTQVYLPLGSVLAMENEGEEELEYLIIKAKRINRSPYSAAETRKPPPPVQDISGLIPLCSPLYNGTDSRLAMCVYLLSLFDTNPFALQFMGDGCSCSRSQKAVQYPIVFICRNFR